MRTCHEESPTIDMVNEEGGQPELQPIGIGRSAFTREHGGPVVFDECLRQSGRKLHSRPKQLTERFRVFHIPDLFAFVVWGLGRQS